MLFGRDEVAGRLLGFAELAAGIAVAEVRITVALRHWKRAGRRLVLMSVSVWMQNDSEELCGSAWRGPRARGSRK